MAARLFGIGAALVLDEFALILHLQDVYWSEDGRTSVDAVFAAVAVAGLLIMGFNPLVFFASHLARRRRRGSARAVVVGGGVLTLPLAVVVLLKGKVWTGLLGMLFSPLLVVGAMRLSRPHAPWARWRYTTRPDKMRRALRARTPDARGPSVRAKLCAAVRDRRNAPVARRRAVDGRAGSRDPRRPPRRVGAMSDRLGPG